MTPPAAQPATQPATTRPADEGSTAMRTRARRLAAIEEYVTVMAEVVAEARELAATGGWPLDAVPDEEVLHGLVRLKDAVAAARRPRSPRPVRRAC